MQTLLIYSHYAKNFSINLAKFKSNNMKYLYNLGLFNLCFIAFSCGSNASIDTLHENIAYIEIIKEDSLGDYTQPLVIKDKAEIKMILSFIKKEEAPEFKCGYDYHLRCFKKNKDILLIDVNSNELCQNAVFVFNDKVHHRFFSDKGIQYLKQTISNN